MAQLGHRIRGGVVRVAVASALVLGVVVAAVAPASAARSGPPPRRNDIEAFARIGDCSAPTEGIACHFVSAVASKHRIALEFTTIEMHEGSEAFVRDVQCNVERAKVDMDPKTGQVAFSDIIPAGYCDVLVGDAPADLDIDVVWSSNGTFAEGDNACTVNLSIDAALFGSPLFCDVVVSSAH